MSRAFRSLALVFAFALAARLLLLWLHYPVGGWGDVAYGSELGHVAVNLAQGRGLSSPFGSGSSPTAWFMPAIPALWALSFRLLGVLTPGSLLAILVLQSVARAAACTVYAHIAQILWRRAGGRGARLPLLVGLAVCAWPESFSLVRYPWYHFWQELSVALLFLAALRWIDVPTLRRAVALGLAGVAVASINPVPLSVLAGVLMIGVVREGCTPGGQLVRRLRQAVVVIGLVVASLVPWVLRNQAELGEVVLTRSNFGVELRQGNHPQGSIVQQLDSLHPALRPLERARFTAMGEMAYVREARQQALQYMADDPLTTLRRALLRVYAYWCSDLTGEWPWDRRDPPDALSQRLGARSLLPLLLCLVAALRGDLRRVPHAALFAAVLLLMPLPYYVTAANLAYAHAVQPWLVLWGGLALCLGHQARAGQS